jgi:hypothetical protein
MDAQGKTISEEKIGWNPRRQQLVSWHFHSNGSYGFGDWEKNGESWSEQTTGVEPDGASSRATDIISKVDANTFTWSSKDRTVGGAPQSHRQAITVNRVR